MSHEEWCLQCSSWVLKFVSHFLWTLTGTYSLNVTFSKNVGFSSPATGWLSRGVYKILSQPNHDCLELTNRVLFVTYCRMCEMTYRVR